VYKDTPSAMQVAEMATGGTVDTRYSLGLYIANDGMVIDVFPGGAADKAKLGPGMMVTNVNGAKFSGAALREAIRRAKTDKAPIKLSATNNSEHAEYALDYHDGEKFPVLERDGSKADLLSMIIAPSKK
jgi:predicted metalloprotease with PDZ domain